MFALFIPSIIKYNTITTTVIAISLNSDRSNKRILYLDVSAVIVYFFIKIGKHSFSGFGTEDNFWNLSVVVCPDHMVYKEEFFKELLTFIFCHTPEHNHFELFVFLL